MVPSRTGVIKVNMNFMDLNQSSVSLEQMPLTNCDFLTIPTSWGYFLLNLPLQLGFEVLFSGLGLGKEFKGIFWFWLFQACMFANMRVLLKVQIYISQHLLFCQVSTRMRSFCEFCSTWFPQNDWLDKHLYKETFVLNFRTFLQRLDILLFPADFLLVKARKCKCIP